MFSNVLKRLIVGQFSVKLSHLPDILPDTSDIHTYIVKYSVTKCKCMVCCFTMQLKPVACTLGLIQIH